MSLSGRTCVVTGATSGIGKALVTELSRRGARVVLACRDLTRAKELCIGLSNASSGNELVAKELDLASFRSVREFARSMSGKPIHVLVHSAGVMMRQAVLTEDRVETTIQVNALSPLLLTSLLRENLERAAGRLDGISARVIYVGSSLEKNGKLEGLFDGTMFLGDEGFAPSYSTSIWPNLKHTMQTYANSKLLATMNSFRLAREWREIQGLGVYVVSPGVVNTNLSRFLPLWTRALASPMQWLLLRTPEKGAETPLWLATSDDPSIQGGSGLYFKDMKVYESSKVSRSTKLQDQVWDICVSRVASHNVATSNNDARD